MRLAVVSVALLFTSLLSCGSAPGPARGQTAPRPNFVVILADDLGWGDVGYHGSEIRTPNLDRLAASGAKLEQFYVQQVCSPTRAALLTGRYPIRTGLQTGVVRPWSRYGLPLQERTLAQALRDAGYRTAIVGKWHLGHHERAYLPTRRGFDSQYGHYNGAIDYFTHLRDGGLDWHRNVRALRVEGYSTELIGAEAVRLIEAHDRARPLFLYLAFNAPHAPLQAPPEYVARFEGITDRRRRTFAARVSCMDEQVGRVAAALEKRGMARDTLMTFSSDNGGPTGQAANNGPLRARKATLYEGGVRVPAWAIWPERLKAGTVVNEPLHVADWYPTLLRLARASLQQRLPLDGRDIWPTLADGKPSPHREILINAEADRGALRSGNWKLVVTGRLPRGERNGPRAVELFDLESDPGETENLAERQPERTRKLLARLQAYVREAVPAKSGNQGGYPSGFKIPAVWGEEGGG